MYVIFGAKKARAGCNVMMKTFWRSVRQGYGPGTMLDISIFILTGDFLKIRLLCCNDCSEWRKLNAV